MCMLPLGSRHLSQKSTLMFSQPKGGKAVKNRQNIQQNVYMWREYRNPWVTQWILVREIVYNSTVLSQLYFWATTSNPSVLVLSFSNST